jgi:hypothetical protein
MTDTLSLEGERMPAASTAVVQRGRPFRPGRSGNPGGRRPGSKNRLTEVFMSAIADDFADHGAKVIARVRRDDPAAYLKIVGTFVPRELVVQRERGPMVDVEGLSLTGFLSLIERLERLKSMREALVQAEHGQSQVKTLNHY